MALGLLLILFMVMSIISVVGLLLLFLLKGERAQKKESNQIGLESIRRITAGYGGAVTVSLDEKQFQIEITLPVVKKCKG